MAEVDSLQEVVIEVAIVVHVDVDILLIKSIMVNWRCTIQWGAIFLWSNDSAVKQ